VQTLRKTSGALLIQKGVDIFRVSKWLGHSSVTVTDQHYVDILTGDYNDLANLMGQIGGGFLPDNSKRLIKVNNNQISENIEKQKQYAFEKRTPNRHF